MSFANAWETYRKTALPNNASPAQVEKLKHAFYVGGEVVTALAERGKIEITAIEIEKYTFKYFLNSLGEQGKKSWERTLKRRTTLPSD